MKVLVVGTGGGLQASGITTAADETASTLRAMGHEVERLTAGTRRRRRPNRLNVENLVAVAGEAILVARRARSGGCELVWLHTFGVPTLPALRTLVQVAAARLVRRRIVVRFHAFALEEHVASGGRFLRWSLRLIGRWSQSLVAEHEMAAAALRDVTRADVQVLHNWVDVPTEPAPLPPTPPWRVVFVGSLGERKGARQLVGALRLLDDLDLVVRLVGGGGEEGAEAVASLQAEAADLVDSGRLVFVGELDRDGVREELRAAHLFVLPSRAEGMPLAMLEALAEGRPVLVADAGNMAAIVRSARCGSVMRSIEPMAIAAAVREALTNRVELLGQAGRSYAVAVRRYSRHAGERGIARVMAARVTPREVV